MTQANETRQYNPAARNLPPVVPTLESVIRLAIDAYGQDLRVCCPCKVVAVRNNYRVDLQPLQQAQYKAEPEPTTLPVLPNAPVAMPGGVNWQVKYPIDVGDVGWAIFADRALDSFLASSGQPVDPVESRTHDLVDAIYVPGLAYDSLASARQDSTTDLVMSNGTASVRLERNGTFRILSGGTKNLEFVDLVGQLAQHCAALVQTLQAAMTTTMLGPQPFYAATQTDLANKLATVQKIAASLGQIKGG